jgi:undecaprenyl-diphosphatase
MSPFHATVLGALQGLTEFLPISSSAHLYVVPTLLGWPDGGLAFDVALHWGTLLALLAAFGRDWWALARDAFARDPAVRRVAHLTWLKLAAATVPAVLAGLLLERFASTTLRALPIQAATLAVFGALLWAADRFGPPGRDQAVPGWGACMVIGLAQALAIVPGVSRSGITMTAGRACALSRVSAARFSFLLATPITFAAGVHELPHFLAPGISWIALAAGIAAAAVIGLLAIRGLIRYLGRAGFGVFFAYRVAFAGFIVWRLVGR